MKGGEPSADSRARSTTAKLGLAGGALLLGLAVGELALRLFVDLETDHHRLACEYDERLGWRKVPNGGGWHITEEYKTYERFNSRGLRGPEHDYDRPAGVYRVLVLGDSFVEGYTVADEDLLTERLRHRLESGLGHPVEVINAGTAGYSTDQMLLFFEHEGRRYAPDLTILVVYENDVLYNTETHVHRGAKPMFVLTDAGELELTNVPPPRPSRGLRRVAAYWALDNLRLARLASLALLQSPGLHRLAARFDLTRAPTPASESVPFEHQVYLTPAPPKVEHSWKVTEALLERLLRGVREAGGELLTFYAPPRSLIYGGDPCRSLGRRYGVPPEACRADAVGQRLGEICERLAIPYRDPVAAMRAEADHLAPRDEVLYFPLDGHWSPAGHALVARLLADHVLGGASGAVPTGR